MSLPFFKKSNLQSIVFFILLFFGLWTLSWLLYKFLAQTVCPQLEASSTYRLLYWVVMKILVWIAFPVLYVKKVLKVKNLNQFLGLQKAKYGIIYGVITSIIWIAISYILSHIQVNQATLNLDFSLTFLWVVTGTPIAEEFTFRGVILPGLQKANLGFWLSNIVTSFLFVLVHCLGWAFQGSLAINLVPMVIGSIFLISLVAGWLRYKADSLYGSTILHAVNNFYSSIT